MEGITPKITGVNKRSAENVRVDFYCYTAVNLTKRIFRMPKFKKKPVVVEARQYLNDSSSFELVGWVNEGQYKRGPEVPFATWENGTLTIPTLEGDHIANVGDWIIEGVQGEFYPCKPDIFEATYEAV